MGNKQCPPPKPLNLPMEHIQTSPQELRPASSFSNPSLVTIEETDDSSSDMSLSNTFSEENMEIIYYKYVEQERKSKGKVIDQDVIKVIWNLIETMSVDDHVLFIATKFVDKFYRNDEHFLTLFKKCAKQRPTLVDQYATYSSENRIILHMMYYLRLHKYILTSFDEGMEEKAYEILNLVALNHLIMKVEQSQFRVFTIQVIRSLLHFSLISEDQIPAFVYYNQTVNNYIIEAMDNYIKRLPSQIERINESNSPARENYRELKKWKAIVLNTTKSLSKPIAQFQKQMADETRKGTSKNFGDDFEEWTIIRMLKKGYKYRKAKVSKTNLLQKT